MSRPAEPTLADLLADLDRAHAEKKERFLQSIADRRLAAERFARLKEEVVHPVFYELERELSRRRHVVKVRDAGPLMELTVAVHAVSPRSGTLRLTQVEGELDTVEIEFVGIPMLRKKFAVEIGKVDRGMVTRAVARLVEGLLAPG
jgi:hypothetical protein